MRSAITRVFRMCEEGIAMLLTEIVQRGHCSFEEGPLAWRDAIRACCEPLVATGTVEPVYADEIIACVEKHGPYIVLVPGVAMPHSTENARGCNGTAIGFTRVAQPVQFDADDRDKDAQIFFTLCDTDPESHFANMQRLYAVLTDEAVLERLKAATSPADLLAIDKLVDEDKFAADHTGAQACGA